MLTTNLQHPVSIFTPMLTTFAPGPSKTYPQLAQIYARGLDAGIGSISHRGQAFMDIYASATTGIQQHLQLPTGYKVYFVSSATECWEVIAQSFTRTASLHFYSGAFGEKWYDYAKAIRPDSEAITFGIDTDPMSLLPAIAKSNADVICLTPNETSNAACLPLPFMQQARYLAGDRLIAADVTSLAGGVMIDWQLADIWFYSVQKCMGMPAGLGIFIVNERAEHTALSLPDTGHYNSFAAIYQNGEKNQTPFTPPVLTIYALSALLPTLPPLAEIDATTRRRAQTYYAYLAQHADLKPLVERPECRSQTVVAVKTTPGHLKELQKTALENGMELGRGYGPWVNYTFRIANFPAITEAEVEKLIRFLE